MFAVDLNTIHDDRQRMHSFKLGKQMPAGAPKPSHHKHQRSHSRNTSISSTASHDLSSFSFGTMSASTSGASSNSPPNPAPPVGPPSKRNSHHRRRSSVSTRRESAELMGVSLPNLPTPSLEDNINLGEKDSIRRRALWALEGKHDVSFSKVEIPELSTPEVEKMMFDFSTKPSFSGGLSAGFGNSLMGNKRDSFKLLSSSGSSKDQLHTLLEEEEEEEETEPQAKKDHMLPSPTSSNEDSSPVVTCPPSVEVTNPTPSRRRPATLNLRPLSLTPENLGATGLPTPSLTPSPRSGLRSLSLGTTTTPDEPARPTRRPSLNLSMDSNSDTSASHDEQKSVRRSSISYRSSYASFNPSGLPTPEMTPTSLSRRSSIAESIRSSKSGDDEFFQAPQSSYRPLSQSEQHFLYKSHNALLARITDLEKALSMRRMSMGGYSISGSSRPSSIMSDASLSSEFGSPAGEPSDEMLALIRDLKAERDELKKDVDGWRTRVADLDKQLGLVSKRVENERREAWVARSRVGLLEAEKGALEKRLEAIDQVVASLETEKLDLQQQNQLLREENEVKGRRVQELEVELQSVKDELASERSKKETHQGMDDFGDSMATPTPQTFDIQTKWRRGLGFTSMDSESSSTDVELDDNRVFNFGFPLKAVEEADEDGDEYYDDDEEDALAGYEDADESDPELETSSSFGSLDDYPQRSTAHFVADVASSTPSSNFDAINNVAEDHASEPPLIPTRPGHRSRHSLSRVWTFPKAMPTPENEAKGHKYTESVDKFFNCLDESDTSDESGPITPMPFNYEESKGLFARGFKYADEDDASFYLPGGVGTVVEPVTPELKNDRKLSAVTEEDEDAGDEVEDRLSVIDDDEDLFGSEIGGIRIIFTPPDEVEEEKEVEQILFASPAKSVSAPPTLPAFDFGHNDDDDEEKVKEGIDAFMFGRSPTMAANGVPSEPAAAPTVRKVATPLSPPRSAPTMITSPSSKPRSASPRSSSPRASSPPSAIPRPTPRSSSASSSAPKRGTSPVSMYSTPPSKRGGVMPSFIPQPVSSPSPSRISSFSRPKSTVQGPTFIRPPASKMKPLLSTPKSIPSKPSTANFENEQASMSPSLCRASNNHSQVVASDQSWQQSRSTSETNMKSVDLRHSAHPLSSDMSESRPHAPIQPISSIFISSFSNFIPLSWSSRPAPQEPTPSPQVRPNVAPIIDRKPAFVSREQQLSKLRRRMAVEGTASMTPSMHCRRCNVEGIVRL